MNKEEDYVESENESQAEPEEDIDENSLSEEDENSEEDDLNSEEDDLNSENSLDEESDNNESIEEESDIQKDSDDENSIILEKNKKMGVQHLLSKLSKKKNKHIQYTNSTLIKKNIFLEKSNKPKIIYIVPESERITSDLLLKSERAHLQAILSKQIDSFGCPEYLNDIVTELKKEHINISFLEIAEAAILQRRCPLKLRRIIGENNKDELIVEEWDPNTMKINATA